MGMKPCPFCGGEAVVMPIIGGNDERSGYNFSAKVACIQCGASTATKSKQDKNGWCVEGAEAVKSRAVEKWERRT